MSSPLFFAGIEVSLNQLQFSTVLWLNTFFAGVKTQILVVLQNAYCPLKSLTMICHIQTKIAKMNDVVLTEQQDTNSFKNTSWLNVIMKFVMSYITCS